MRFRLDPLKVQAIVNVDSIKLLSFAVTDVLTVFGGAKEVVLMLVVCGSRILSTRVGQLHILTVSSAAHSWVLCYQILCCVLVDRDSDYGQERLL